MALRRVFGMGVLTVTTMMMAFAKPSAGPIDKITYSLIAVEHARDAEAPLLTELAAHPSPDVRARLALTLARIADDRLLGLVEQLLQDGDPTVQAKAAFALGQFDSDNSRKLLDVLFEREEDPVVLGQAYKSLGFVGGNNAIGYFERGLQQPATAAAAAQGLGKWLIFKAGEMTPHLGIIQTLLQLSQSSRQDLASAAAFALSRVGEFPQETDGFAAARAAQTASVPAAKTYLIRAASRFDNPFTRNALTYFAHQPLPPLRVEALRGINRLEPTAESAELVLAALDDPSAQVAVQAAQVLQGELGGLVDLSQATHVLYGDSTWRKGEFLLALAKHNKDVADLFAREALLADDPQIYRYGALALATNGTTEQASELTADLLTGSIHQQRAVAEALLNFSREVLTAEHFARLATTFATKDLAIVYYASQLAMITEHRGTFESLLDLYPTLTDPGDVEAKVAVLEAVGALGDDSHLPLLEEALSDTVKQVVAAAAAAHQKITGQDMSHRVPVNSPTEAPLPSLAELNAALVATVTFETTRGPIQMRLLELAPLTAHTIVELARSDFYHGKTFHRVVPHFVAQGGDPRGDGFGGLDYSIRDEVETTNHTEGIVGIATAGKDTGSCQFFVNHGSNLHLDGRYTTFAKVISGMATVQRLQQGDVILRTLVD